MTGTFPSTIMVALVLIITLTLTLAPLPAQGWSLEELESLDSLSQNGGVSCAACTIVTSLLEQLSVRDNVTVVHWVEKICKILPLGVKDVCVVYAEMYGPEVIKLLEKGLSPDQVCHGVKVCTEPTCRLFPSSVTDDEVLMAYVEEAQARMSKRAVQFNVWTWLKDLFNPLAKNHSPELDLDKDGFGFLSAQLRGTNWKGVDCDDFSSKIYPGRKSGDLKEDYNCNGIVYGNNTDYKTEFCANSGQLGILALGDSATAHFQLPPKWLNATMIHDGTYNDLLSVVADEIDLPHLSSTTGFVPTSDEVPVFSIYQQLLARNRCNHGDFQNAGVNGARSTSAVGIVKTALKRNSVLDHPALVEISLIGNDICSPRHSLEHFTTVAEFKENILEILNYLDTILPPGSHVMTVGLAQGGSVLYGNMYNRTHPLGMSYKDVYDFLNCLGINPCWAWLNSDKSIRDAGDKRAAELSAVYPEIVANYKFKNFDMLSIPFPFDSMIKKWTAQGGEVWELIEPSDGFHPSQRGNQLLGMAKWELLMSQKPEWLGKVNPYNSEIIQKFGDQGPQ
eukprot:TRINITY_DN7399_c0_g1_i1.p1 TRINITY_DN7399_c0_g1~~TRINITY_DN7399_c0_g1_i1.p1  ORF type:complete len:563 (-),score=138.08 TRINITY_DN7399_c0_g1_i1:157-1845(-)